jgi:hypothetical protein
MADVDPAAMLAMHRPTVQYDSLESYYTDWAGVISDRPGNVLKQADGTVLAAAGPRISGIPVLNLAFLQPEVYPTGEPATATDYIDQSGKDSVGAAREMHARPGYANKAHGRVVAQAGVTWLQYWLFMYYDDPGFLGLGRHEGDIEMVQIRLGQDGQPDAVSYSQHRTGVRASWDEVETDGPSPIVYSARGSHASMLRSGTLRSDRSFLPDHNDARGPRAKLDLVVLSEAQTPWASWPGSWGGTRAEHFILGRVGIEANSPASLTGRPAWRHPAAFHDRCDAMPLPPRGTPHLADVEPPPQPQLTVRMAPGGGMAHISYRFPKDAPTPRNIVIGVDTSRGQLPPATTVVPVEGRTGELVAPLSPGTKSVEIRAATHSDEGAVSPTVTAKAKPARASKR